MEQRVNAQPVRAVEVQQNLQQLAQVCQTNFQQMSDNDKVLVDMAVTNTVNIRAIMDYLKDQGADLQPYIDAELKRREEEQAAMQAKAEELQKQAEEQLKAAADQPPPEGDDSPLIFGGGVGEEGEDDVIGETGNAEDNSSG